MGTEYRPILGAPSQPQRPGQALLDYAIGVLEREDGRSLGPRQRATFMAAQGGDAHVTAHHNADRAHGTAVLVPPGTIASSARARASKRFLKYLDPLNNGKHGSGIKFNGAWLVTHAPSPDYVYLETDFMDTPEPTAPGGVRYGFMVDEARFICPAAEQILAATVEALFQPQPDAELDAANIGVPE
jgi:hypothetical protein